jgi:PAS domain S-box-containing protein
MADERRPGPLKGGGEMGALMRAFDWARTSLGPVEEWPQSLRTAASIVLQSRFPMYIAWGPEYVQLYNDGYRPILGSTKHPAALGNRAANTFAESWHIIGPMFDDVRRGNATGAEDWMLPLDRHGYLEECYFTFSYSPISAGTGEVAGVIVTVTETTARVLGERRLRILHELSNQTGKVKTPEEACATAAKVLEGHDADVPFALFYLLDGEGATARLAATVRMAPGGPASPMQLEVGRDGEKKWPLSRVIQSGDVEVVTDLQARFGALPGGRWPEQAATGVVQPIARPGSKTPYGLLLAGVSPRRKLDKQYLDFFSLVASHVATALTNASAFEQERQRAQVLAELDRAKTAFFSNVSHEFRTPLTLLLGPAEDALAAGESLEPAERERWSLVLRNGRRLAKLVNTLLDFARIEAGRADASYAPTDLAPVTAELASMFHSAIERAGLRLSLDLQPIGEPVFVDREMWEKIVLNLLSNALKFTFEGEIAVSLQRREGHVELVVRDSGTGIAAAELPHLFERFHRIRGARARTQEGSGIGLALVQELARLHGGRIEATSAEGQGSTFRVRVPLGSSHLPADRIGVPKSTRPFASVGAYVEEANQWGPGPAAAESVERLESGPRARILLIDDNADMRSYVSRLLRDRWEVQEVSDGLTALEVIRERPPDLVLSDVMMPGLDGFALVRELRQDPRHQLLPVILLSARAGEEATAEGLEAGANDYLVKPFSARELLVRVSSLLGAARTARETQAIVEEERARLYMHFMQAPFPIGVLRGPQHVFELANDEALHVWGKDRGIIGKPIVLAMPELVGQAFIGYLDGVLQTGVAFHGKEALARLARGPQGAVEDTYFNFVYSPLRDRSGAVEGVLVCGFEVTDQVVARRVVEKALAEAARLNDELGRAEQLFRIMADNLPQLAWSARPDGYIEFYNRRWYEYTGTTFEEMRGWGWKSVHAPEMLEEAVARWQRSLNSGEPFEMEFPLRDAHGRFRWFLTRVNPLKDARGNVLRWVGTNTDVHEQREARRRTNEFLAMLGHELRNPLSPILTAIDLSRMRGDQSRELRVIDRQARHLVRLVDDLLDVSRITRGHIELRARPLKLGEVIASALEIARPLVEANRHVVRTEVPDDLLLVADATRLAQALANLLTNAAKYSPPGTTIDVVTERYDGKVAVKIRDQGIGIPSDMLDKVFDLFVQLPEGKDRSLGGLGLGLAIVRSLIELHGGTVVARSDGLGKGSEFIVELPIGQPKEAGPAPAPPLPIPEGQGTRVLLVDDNEDAVSLLSDGLEHLGYEVRIALNGSEALRIAETFQPQVGLLDIGLPGMNGYELAKRLRAILPCDSRLIALTGYGQETDREAAERAGFALHLVKPVELADLERALASVR